MNRFQLHAHLVARFATGLVAMALLGASFTTSANAKIRCDGAFQIIRGEGLHASPYCEDQYLARVARGYGIRVSGRQIRRSPSKKEEVCKAIGHDSRVYSSCLQFRNDGCSYRSC